MRGFNSISKNEKITFFTSLIVGVASQGMGMFNKFSIHDDANSLFGLGSTFNVGRWMLDLIGKFEKFFFGDANYSLPLYNGLLSLIFIALTACIIVRTFEISDSVICGFIGGIMACFPTVTSAFGFIYGAHIIMFGLLIGIYGANLICTSDRMALKVVGILLLASSVGIYQAFIPIIVSFILFYCIHMVLKAEAKDVKNTVIAVILKPVDIVIFMAVYFVINSAYLRYLGAELSSYKGVNQVGKTPVSDYIIRVLVAYKQFLLPSKDSNFYMYPSNIRILYYIFVIIGVIYAGYSVYKKSKESVVLAIGLMCLFALVPMATNFIIVMTGADVVHSYMMYAAVMPFVLAVYLVDHYKFSGVAFFQKFVIIACGILLIMNIRYDNKCYFLANFVQQEAISYYNTLITRIKSASGYSDEYPVVFINQCNITDESLRGVESVKRGTFDDVNIIPYWNVQTSINNYAWLDFMQNWCGYKPVVAGEDQIPADVDVSTMPSYPKDGSIRVEDEIVIVKF